MGFLKVHLSTLHSHVSLFGLPVYDCASMTHYDDTGDDNKTRILFESLNPFSSKESPFTFLHLPPPPSVYFVLLSLGSLCHRCSSRIQDGGCLLQNMVQVDNLKTRSHAHT